ncbi:MAG: hypothetical protein ACD_15C00204G0025 [uncultured bacterium]|nr:MAG: hypothetical protein ACD_15C00204G0025 [uncultured bacterium]HCU70269.1 hypothetical protein [Candidatus Moranbacteria bacterium]
MNKKNLFIGAVAVLGLMAAVFTMNNVSAAPNGDNYGYGNMGSMMGNFDSNGFQKMSEAHNLMAQGKYNEARNIMQNFGMGNCPMLNGNFGNGNRN